MPRRIRRLRCWVRGSLPAISGHACAGGCPGRVRPGVGDDVTENKGRNRVRRVGLLAGPCVALLVAMLLPATDGAATSGAELLSSGARITAGLAAWMAIWWMTEAIPLYATALLPLAVLPLAGARTLRETASPYAHELIFLFMGGFVLALAMQRWKLDRRIALSVLQRVGPRPGRVVAGFMGLTALFSMWVSNTATAVMMLPIAVSVIALLGEPAPDASETNRLAPEAPEGAAFASALLLGIAYAASIGGVGTLIGTPPNLFMASFASQELGIEIGFARWMAVGLPLVAIFLPITWWLLTRIAFPIRVRHIPGGEASFRKAALALGPMQRAEWLTFGVFLCAAMAWMTRPWLSAIEIGGARPLVGLSDPGIAIVAALALFILPAGRDQGAVMNWDTAVQLPWGLLLLFGGGLSLAAALQAHGIGAFLGEQVRALADVPAWLLVLSVVTGMIFLTEITSNTATAATLVPILAGIAPGLGVEPLVLVVPATVAASCAFMLPVATPPNAVVFGSGRVQIGDMLRAGLWLNLIGIGLITGLVYTLVLRILLGG
ncbi:MAG: DASS family sodium-coupled anion symporter [Deltaproteobacteria bacterium]|nr:DASS family sodium-coupled anion symporter [Deltaproteobacteria bacterium]